MAMVVQNGTGRGSRALAGLLLGAAGIAAFALAAPRAALGEEAPGPPVLTERDVEGARLYAGEHRAALARSRSFATILRVANERDRAIALARALREQTERLDEAGARLDAARRHAIAALEAFLARHPSDPTTTPDVMHRLAELTFDEANATYAQALDRYEAELARFEAGELAAPPAEPARDLGRPIGLLRELIRSFPAYPHLDRALSALGYCLLEAGAPEDALAAWRGLVCPNRFPLAPASGPAPAAGPASYDGCTPLSASSPFLDEAWLRIGEYHFDYGVGANGLPLAVAAYRNVLGHPRSPHFELALYKLAWSFYRMDRYRDAVESFAGLVERADAAPAGPESAARELRAEAVQYLAICFAESDWDADASPDGVAVVDRLQDASLLPQDRPFTFEVYAGTGDVLFEVATYTEAIEVYELTLRRWPLAPGAPGVLRRIIQCHERSRSFDAAAAARARLASEYGPDGEWARANRPAAPAGHAP